MTCRAVYFLRFVVLHLAVCIPRASSGCVFIVDGLERIGQRHALMRLRLLFYLYSYVRLASALTTVSAIDGAWLADGTTRQRVHYYQV